MMDRLRRSGRTTRMLDHAAALADEGKYVFVIGWDEQHIKYLFDAFMDRRHCGVHSGIRQAGRMRKVYVEAGGTTGSVTFERAESVRLDWNTCRPLGAHPSCEVLVDHFAIESVFPRAVEMLRRYESQPNDSRERLKGEE